MCGLSVKKIIEKESGFQFHFLKCVHHEMKSIWNLYVLLFFLFFQAVLANSKQANTQHTHEYKCLNDYYASREQKRKMCDAVWLPASPSGMQ